MGSHAFQFSWFLATLCIGRLESEESNQRVDVSRDAKPAHWAFRPVVRSSPPTVQRKEWSRGPIDDFVLARVEAAGLSPSPEADRLTLIRRLFLDLHGLVPSMEEVEAFVRDEDPNAYAKLVDRLLASPRYGERWGRHWLDVVRFAETHGFEMNQPRDNAWPYRDYVIRSFNEDTPYPRFVVEQIAGDAVGEDAATGFLVGGAWDQVKSPDVQLTLQQRMDELHDMVSTTGSAFLGLTVGCARCHDHKFDPISQHDYYSVLAVLRGVQHGDRELTPPDWPRREAKADGLRREIELLDTRLRELEPFASPSPPADAPPRRPAVSSMLNVDRFAPVEAKVIRFTVFATTDAEPCIDELEVFAASSSPRNVALASLGARARSSSDFPGAAIHKLEHVNDGSYGNSRSWISAERGAGWVELELSEKLLIDRVEWARDREGQFQDRLAIRYRIDVASEPGGGWMTVATSEDRVPYKPGALPGPAYVAAGISPEARSKLEGLTSRRIALTEELRQLTSRPKVYAGVFAQPGETHVLHRGDPQQEREAVTPGAIASLGHPLGLAPGAPERDRRLSLARWIAAPENPLTARVLVNRVWLHHFGEGLVSTPSDFGANGALPSHPELLDWLASELVARGWSLKVLQRLILLSSTYRQSSRPDPAALAADAQARLLWRFPPRRLEAEAVRDGILSVTGKLDLSMGGPGFSAFEPNSNYVRVYEPKKSFGPPEWRRMVYQQKVRMQQDGTFGTFDCPDGGQVCPKRTRSTTALQSLNLLNSSFMLEQAGAFAERLEREAGADAPAQVRHAFRAVFGREPDQAEAAASLKLVEGHGLKALCRALFNANEFLFIN